MGNHRHCVTGQASVCSGRRGDRAFATGGSSRPPDQTRVEKGAACSPQAGDKLWKDPAQHSALDESPPLLGSRSMEGTSGFDDLGCPSRDAGGSEPWSLDGWAARADRPSNRAERAARTGSRKRAGAGGGRFVEAAREQRVGAVGARRKPVVRGARRSELLTGRLRCVGAGCAWQSRSIVAGLRLGCDRRRRLLRPAARRSCDRRCARWIELG